MTAPGRDVIELVIRTPEEMNALGRRIGGQLRAGDIVALSGELGAGKTTLTRGLGEELGVRGTVTSPTFVLARTHPREAGPPLVHVDAYRLGSAAELDDLDIDFERSIVVVEWADGMLDGVNDSLLAVRIDRPTGAGGTGVPGSGRLDEEPIEPRRVTIAPSGPRWRGHPFA